MSDHNPIKMELFNTSMSKKQFRFKFENTWLKEDNFHSDVIAFWRQLSAIHILPKLISMTFYMAKWGRVFFHKFRDKVLKQKKSIEELRDREDEDGVQQFFEEKEKLHELMLHEETYKKQRAKSFWLEEDDTNSKFFHASASSRNKVNHIKELKSENGFLVSNQDDLCNLLKEYYSKVFAGYECRSCEPDISSDVSISDNQNVMLVAELQFEEFTEAVKCMHPDKASGPNGLNPAFFQHFWNLVGSDIFCNCKQWLLDCKFPATVNDTTLVLIPKKENVVKIKDLCPISLCNVLYKIVAKVLSNRLQKILPCIILEEQSAFVPGRHITDNVVVAFELLNYMRHKKEGQEGEVALNLDISKAYDMVSWQYLKSRMAVMEFCQTRINWVMLCVTMVSNMEPY